MYIVYSQSCNTCTCRSLENASKSVGVLLICSVLVLSVIKIQLNKVQRINVPIFLQHMCHSGMWFA